MCNREYPKTVHQVMTEYQAELEQWVAAADIEKIRKYLLGLHGAVYPIDWDDFLAHHLKYFGNGSNYISGCENCQEIMLAINTVSRTKRLELNSLFNTR